MTTLRFLFSLLLLGLVAGPGAAAQPRAAAAEVPAGRLEEQQALDAMQQLLAAFCEGNYAQAEALIDPQMTGQTQLVQTLRQTGHLQNQLRINLSDTRNLVSRDVAVIRTRWEKRYLLLPALTAQRRSGSTTFVMHREAGAWRLSALSGDNPFTVD